MMVAPLSLWLPISSIAGKAGAAHRHSCIACCLCTASAAYPASLSQVLLAPTRGRNLVDHARCRQYTQSSVGRNFNGLHLGARRVTNTFPLGTDLCSINMVRVVSFPVRVAKRVVMPAVLSGGSRVIASAVAALSVITITPPSSSACTVAMPTFVCRFRSI